jgi:predicted nucleic-acid-binding protein
MIGLDTNVLVRYLTQDDPAQAKTATRFIEQSAARGETFYIPTIVTCELVWVLEDAYGFARPEIRAALEAVFRTAQFQFEKKDQLWQSLHDYRNGRGDFADYLIGRVAVDAGCELTATFDRSLKNSRLFQLLR